MTDRVSDSKPRELRPVVTFPRDAILEASHLAAAIGVDEAVIAKMDLPCFYPSRRPRYLWGQVLDCLAERASPDNLPEARRVARPSRSKTRSPSRSST